MKAYITAIVLVVLLAMGFGTGGASEDNWRIGFAPGDAAGLGSGLTMHIGVFPGAADGADSYDLVADYLLDGTLTTIWGVGNLGDGNTYIRDIKAGDLALPKVWDLRVAALPDSWYTEIRLRFVELSPTLNPPTSVSGVGVTYELEMIDNRGKGGAPPNGTVWDVSGITTGGPVVIGPDFPMLKLSAPTHTAMLNEGYILEFRQGEPKVATPIFEPDGGTYDSPVSVTVSCGTPDATIHYTTDGADPTESDPVIGSGSSLLVAESLTLKAKAWKTGVTPSDVKSADYVITNVATPDFNRSSGTYLSSVTVTVTCLTPDATIHYTTDGADPTETDPTIASGASLLIDRSLTLKAKAWKTGLAPSDVKSADYIIKVAKPTFSPDAGAYPSAQDVTISCTTGDATIHYTTDGNDPTESDPTVASGSSVLVDTTMTLKAGAWKDGCTPSDIKSALYVIRSPGTVYVSKNAPGPVHDGTSWATAFLTVGEALSYSMAGDELWVAAGTYVENIAVGDGVAVYGGFAGTEALREQRDWALNVTILDGDQAGSVVSVPSGASANTVIDGFTIQNGRAYEGGGVFCAGASATIRNNIIANNVARAVSYHLTGHGAGIYCSAGSPQIVNNAIVGNTAIGVFEYTCIPPPVDECFITDAGGGDGGGIYCSSSSSPIISNNVIGSNSASGWTGWLGSGDGYGGGIYCRSPSSTITNNTIAENTARTSGAGIRFESSSSAVSNNIVAFNDGSGISNSGGTPTLRNNCVYGNTGYDYSGLSAGTGDISADPLFVDQGNGDYHLTVASPCVNAGWNGAPAMPSTDMDSQPRIMAWIVDIGADEFPFSELNISDAKKSADNSNVAVGGAIIPGAFTDFFYTESDDRSSGIRVDYSGHTLTAGMRADVAGVTKTNPWGERYIDAVIAIQDGTGSVDPVFLINRSTGGGDCNYNPVTGAGQKGVKDSTELNNIGLLITTIGRVTYVGGDHFYLDDGSRVVDNSGNIGVKVLADGLALPAPDEYVKVTGISSCFKSGDDLYRLVRVRDQADIVVLQ